MNFLFKLCEQLDSQKLDKINVMQKHNLEVSF